ncbi:AcrR family transcriptional regulator [Prauserella sediminis]|uniref:AcrR family transcriptional regulator n=1 Tax=Prauserella sediminis TaxID=577680 RepID=A0A839XU52_9PSEU|nr:TetR/AcrR family transcriptional regulator [Prauserella sediminis]MBB3663365.1 AcrR family transcriptional regulator [Prauserella sediminis]
MSTKERLVEAGLRLLESEGPESLNARKLAAEIGASTMTVYTHFGGMAGLYEALVRQAFVQFAQALAAVERTDDAVSDLLTLGLAYRDFASASPQRYRLMFGVTAPGSGIAAPHDLTEEGTPSGIPEASETFGELRKAVQRALDAGRIDGDDSVAIAAQFWSMIHGFVLLEMSGFFGTEGGGVTTVLAPHATNLLMGLGDDQAAVARSAQSARERFGDATTTTRPGPPTADVRRGPRPRTDRKRT